ncbi:nucleoside diphosphate kinase regulator [Thermomonas sp. S9]|uniref:nucleoside diphosphate kinase regulator n=1 Tax=Thermomonas sp. S9 TaxID=2885203 RepID=UPI00216B6531|nr:nucleoside diphosphate kinase regulator [Thermomonas sp. S9]MCR6496781.1 nucleoside diphosphate kinase regulator [Thermomonas sp. S9]
MSTTDQRPALLLSRIDVERIEELLDQPRYRSLDTAPLREELERAELVEPGDMPNDVITMNSTALVQVIDDQQHVREYELTLVYPRDADGNGEKVSILAPVGSALLGLRVGDSIDWPLPGGRSARLHVLSIRYQPEAAGELHR